MFASFINALRSFVASVNLARDYNSSYLACATDPADLERRMRELDRQTPRFPTF